MKHHKHTLLNQPEKPASLIQSSPILKEEII